MDPILVGKGERPVYLLPKYGNRHGLVAGATGTGKTVSLVERTLIAPPRCRMGAITLDERMAVRAQSPLSGKYDTAMNRESAYELLSQRHSASAPSGEPPQGPFREPHGSRDRPASPTAGGRISDVVFGTRRRQGMVETMAKQAARTVGSRVGREIVRGILGGILGGSRRS